MTAIGMGDELMAAGEAGRVRRPGAPPVAILDRKGVPRWHEIWDHCPDVLRPEDWTPGAPSISNCGRLRPYIDWPASLKSRWRFLPYQPVPARVVLPPALLAAAERWRGRVIIEPNLKKKASPNKDWGWRRWGELTQVRPDLPWLQVGPVGTKALPTAKTLDKTIKREQPKQDLLSMFMTNEADEGVQGKGAKIVGMDPKRAKGIHLGKAG